MFWFEIILGLIQFFKIPFIYETLLPRRDVFIADNWYVKGELGLAGSFKFTVDYGLFMFAFSLFIFIIDKPIRTKFSYLFMSLLFAILSHSTMSVIATVIVIIAATHIDFPRFRNQLILLILLIIFPYIIFKSDQIKLLIESINSLGSVWVYEQLKFSRLGIFQLVPHFFSNSLLSIFFGIGMNNEFYLSYLSDTLGSNIPHVLRNFPLIGIEDVYWIAHLHFFGILGVVFFVRYFLSLRKIFEPSDITYRKFTVIILTVFLCSFVNQIFSMKIFMTCFLMILSYMISLKENKGTKIKNIES
jgi:hypothetical protein